MDKADYKKTFEEAKEKTSEFVKDFGEKAGKAKDEIVLQAVKIIDENGNGKIDLEDFIVKALRVPGVHIDRTEYLRTALKKYCSEETIEKAIKTSPAKAGIDISIADKAANESIAKQKTIATTTSLGLGYVPGGIAADIASTVADIAQYYAHQLIIMQKLMYIYGYPELDLKQGETGIDDGTMNMIIICVGAMAGVQEASKYILKFSSMLAEGVGKKVMAQALTKVTAYKVAKKVLKLFGVKLTKQVASKGISNSIKFLGGVLVGGITLVTFSASCSNFQKVMRETPLADPNYVDPANVVDGSCTTVEEVESELEKSVDITEEEESSEE